MASSSVRPQSMMAQSFASSLDTLFGLDGSFERSQTLDQKRRDLTFATAELDSLSQRVRATERRIHRTASMIPGSQLADMAEQLAQTLRLQTLSEEDEREHENETEMAPELCLSPSVTSTADPLTPPRLSLPLRSKLVDEDSEMSPATRVMGFDAATLAALGGSSLSPSHSIHPQPQPQPHVHSLDGQQDQDQETETEWEVVPVPVPRTETRRRRDFTISPSSASPIILESVDDENESENIDLRPRPRTLMAPSPSGRDYRQSLIDFASWKRMRKQMGLVSTDEEEEDDDDEEQRL